MKPERIWWWSTRLHRAGLTPLAWLLKTYNFFMFRAILPYECEIEPDIKLFHRGFNVVVHPRTKIGRSVRIGYGVGIGGGFQEEDSTLGTVIEDGAFIGSGSFLWPARGRELRIGAGAIVGAHAIVTDDVAPDDKVASPKATSISSHSRMA